MVSPDTLTPALLSTTYFGPIQWYQKLHRHKPCLIERHESFIKQTYRNRMVIATANGAQTLSIPVTHDDSMLITDIRISDHANWRHVHWNALASAYGESAFFEYYQDDIRPFFEQKWEFLYDFNRELVDVVRGIAGIKKELRYSEEYIVASPADEDLRCYSFLGTPTLPNREPLPTYWQVFSERVPFEPNLSILDYIFNEGK